MTRINVGITPDELCDQHLIAEIRELPRVIGTRIATPPPSKFKLGTGHVSWCAQYQGSLILRWNDLLDEAEYRSFECSSQTKREPWNNERWGIMDGVLARRLVKDRICDRLLTMKREPRWTKRIRPNWTFRKDGTCQD